MAALARWPLLGMSVKRGSTVVKMLCTAIDVGIYGLLASQSCYHSMLAPCWFTLWTSSRFLYPYILLISLEIFLFSFSSGGELYTLRYT